MLIDFLLLNLSAIYTSTVLINIFYLNDHKIYYILIIDLIINGFPLITIFIVCFYFLNLIIFRKLNTNFIIKYGLIIVYYFIFGILISSIFNEFNFFVVKYLISYLPLNAFIYFIGLKYLDDKYN